MGRTYRVISGDGHLETPPDPWVKYVPAAHRERAPRLVRLPDGGDAWIVEGQPMLRTGQNLTGGGPVRFSQGAYTDADGRPVPGAGGAAQRLQEQDADGVDAEVLFPPVFVTRFIEGIKDRDAYLAIVRAYNTFLAEEFCAVAPDRLIGAAFMPVTGLDDAVAELEWAASHGLRTVMFQQFPNGRGQAKPEDDRFWERSLELGMALSPHVTFGDTAHPPTGRHDTSLWPAFAGMSQHAYALVPGYTLAQLIVGGVFDRFPEIRFYFAETNCVYLPGLLYYMDRDHREYNDWFQVTLKMRPSEYVEQHALFGMIQEHPVVPMAQAGLLRWDRLIWGNDFPHSVGTWPRSQEYLGTIFSGVPDDVRRTVLLETPAAFYGLDLDADITETPEAAVLGRVVDVLQRLRVVECATEIAGPYCTKLFADAGADVVKVEPPGGDPLRHRAAAGASGDAPLFEFLNAGKRSVVATPGDGHLDELLASADLLVDSLGPGVLDHDELRRRHPWLVVVALSPYGYHGPYRDQPATEFTVQAESGSMAGRGRPDRAPFQVGGRLFEWLQGTCAAVAAFAALLRAHATGEGELVDSSLMEACDLGGSVYADLTYQLMGSPTVGAPPRRVEIPSIEPTADGWVGFNTNTRQMFESFLTMIGRTELLDEDASWAQAPVRWARADEWNAMVRAWTTQHTTDEIVELATLFRIPVAQVNNGQTVLAHPQFIARGLWADAPDGTFVHPLPPYRLDGERPRPRGPAPKLGEHQDTVEVRPAPTQRASAAPGGLDATSLPLAGVRVVDATAWWAGPASTGVLAALGAEVIHVESVQHPDGMRMTGGAFIDQPSWWERSSVYLGANVNKENVTLDLASPSGRELFVRLVEQADVLVENFSPRVFETFGITWDAVRAANPRIVMVRMPAFGLDGPWRDNVGFAQTMEQMTGLAWVTGYPDDQPRIPGGPCDPLAGMSAAFATLVGLERRRDTGHGCFIEVSMVESALNAAAEQVIEYTANGTVLSRLGNRSRDAAPQGLYACRGDEHWLALSVANDEQWQALRSVLGQPTWAEDAALDTFEGRRDAHDRVDEHLAAWAREHELHDAVALLVAGGVPAAPLRDPRTISTHPQMVARGHFEGVDHPIIGRLAVPVPPFKYASVGRWVRCAAPLLGQHNGEVLTGLLGVDAPRLDELADAQVIGTTPIGLS